MKPGVVQRVPPYHLIDTVTKELKCLTLRQSGNNSDELSGC